MKNIHMKRAFIFIVRAPTGGLGMWLSSRVLVMGPLDLCLSTIGEKQQTTKEIKHPSQICLTQLFLSLSSLAAWPSPS